MIVWVLIVSARQPRRDWSGPIRVRDSLIHENSKYGKVSKGGRRGGQERGFRRRERSFVSYLGDLTEFCAIRVEVYM